MTFLNPAAAAFVVLVPLIVVLFMLRQQRRRIVVPSLERWEASRTSAKRRRAWGRVDDWLSLILTLLALLSLITALMDPAWTGARHRQALVVVIDNSLRMNAKADDGSSALDRAAAIAERLAAQATQEAPVAVLTTSGDVLQPLGTHPIRPGDAFSVPPSDSAGSFDSILAVARDLLESTGGGKIIFVTDREIANPPQDVNVVSVGVPGANAAVTDLAAREDSGGQSVDLFWSVANLSDQPLTRPLELRIDDRLVDVVSMNVEPGGETSGIVRLGRSEIGEGAGKVTATLEGADSLPEDDVARAVFAGARRPRVLLVSKGDSYLEKAIAADPGIAFELLTPEAWQSTFASSFDVVVFDDWVPPDWDEGLSGTTNFLFAGKNPWSSDDPLLSEVPVTDVIQGHPTLVQVSLRDVRVARAFKLSDPGRWLAVARSGDDPLLAVREDAGGHRSAVLAFRPTDSDLPLKVAYPLLVANLVHWLAGDEAIRARRAGEFVTFPRGMTAAAQYDRAEFYPVQAAGRTNWLAINPATDPLPDLRQNLTANNSIPLPFTIPPLSQIAALLAALLLLAEWWHIHRKAM